MGCVVIKRAVAEFALLWKDEKEHEEVECVADTKFKAYAAAYG